MTGSKNQAGNLAAAQVRDEVGDEVGNGMATQMGRWVSSALLPYLWPMLLIGQQCRLGDLAAAACMGSRAEGSSGDGEATNQGTGQQLALLM